MSEEKKPEKLEYYVCAENPLDCEGEPQTEKEAMKDLWENNETAPRGILYKVELTPIKKVIFKRNTTVDIVEEEL